MFFDSDDAGPVPDQIIDAIRDANNGYHKAYGEDRFMADVQGSLREIFEAPEAAVYLVGTGTAANALALASLGKQFSVLPLHISKKMNAMRQSFSLVAQS